MERIIRYSEAKAESERSPIGLSDILRQRLNDFLRLLKQKPFLIGPLKEFEEFFLTYHQDASLDKKGFSPFFPFISPLFADNWFLFVELESKDITSCFTKLPEELAEKDIEDIKRMFIESLALAEDPYFSPLKALDKRAVFGAFKIFSTIYSDFNITEEKGKRTLKEEERDFLGKKVKVKSSYFEEEINLFFQMADVILQEDFFLSLIDETSSVNEALITTILQTKESEGISDNFKTMVKYIFNQFGGRFSFFADLFSDKTLDLSEFWLKTQAMRYLAELHLSEGLKEKFIGAIDAVLKKIEQRLNEGEKVRRRNEVYFDHFINNPQDENAKSAKKLFLSALFPFSNLESESLKEFSFEEVLAKLFQGLDRQRIIYEIATGKLVIQSEKIPTLASFFLKKAGFNDDDLLNLFVSFVRKKYEKGNGFFLTANQFLGDFLDFLGKEIENAYRNYPEPFYVFFVVNYYKDFFERLARDKDKAVEIFSKDKIRQVSEINVWEILRAAADLIKKRAKKEDGDQKERLSPKGIKRKLKELGFNQWCVEDVFNYFFHVITDLSQSPIGRLTLLKPKKINVEGYQFINDDGSLFLNPNPPRFTGVKHLLIQGPPGTGKTRLIMRINDMGSEMKYNYISYFINGTALVVEPYKGLTFRQILANLVKQIAQENHISEEEAAVYLEERGVIFFIDEADYLLTINSRGTDDDSRAATAKDLDIFLDTTEQKINFNLSDGSIFPFSNEKVYIVLIGSFSGHNIYDLMRLQSPSSPLTPAYSSSIQTKANYDEINEKVKNALGMVVSPDLMRRLLVAHIPEPDLDLTFISAMILLNSLWVVLLEFLEREPWPRIISDKEKKTIYEIAAVVFTQKLYPKLSEIYTRVLMNLKSFLSEEEFKGDLFRLILNSVAINLGVDIKLPLVVEEES